MIVIVVRKITMRCSFPIYNAIMVLAINLLVGRRLANEQILLRTVHMSCCCCYSKILFIMLKFGGGCLKRVFVGCTQVLYDVSIGTNMDL